MKKIFTLLTAAVVGACAASAQTVVQSWSDATYIGVTGSETSCTVNLLDDGSYQIVNPYGNYTWGDTYETWYDYYYPLTLTLKVTEDNKIEYVSGLTPYEYDGQEYLYAYIGVDYRAYYEGTSEYGEWLLDYFYFDQEFCGFNNTPVARKPWVDKLTWYVSGSRGEGYVSVSWNNRGTIDSIDTKAKVGLQRVETNEEEDVLTAEVAYHDVTVYNMADGSAYVFNPFGTGEEADVLHFTVSNIESSSDSEWPYLVAKGDVVFDNLSGSGKNARYITLEDVSYYVLDSKSNDEKYGYYRFQGEPRTGVSYWADEIHFRINLKNEKVEGASIAPAILRLVYNLDEKEWGVNTTEPIVLRLGEDETTDRDADLVIYDNRQMEVADVFGEGYENDNFIFEVNYGKLSVVSFDGVNEDGLKTWTIQDAEGNDVVVTFNEKKSYFGTNYEVVEGTQLVDGVEREGKYTEWAYIYTEPFGYIDIFMGFEADPYIVESYEAEVWLAQADETIVNRQLDVYNNGEYVLTNYLGDNYLVDVVFTLDNDMLMIENAESSDYGDYLNIWDIENEEYIQPYVYYGMMYGYQYSGYYEVPTGITIHGYEDETAYTKYGYFCTQTYENGSWDFQQVFILWDVYEDETTSIQSISVESTEDAPAVYYNLNGVRVDNPTPGIYVVKQGNKVTKQVIR